MMLSDHRFLIDEVNKIPIGRPRDLVHEFAEERRVMPDSTPIPGPYSSDVTPYSVEIMDNMGPYSGVEHTALMKAVQIGMTVACENVVAYYMSELPAEILYISATEALLDKWVSKRLEPMIDSCGIRDRIYAQAESLGGKKGGRRTGDRAYSKEFIGGCLDMVSAQSASGLRSDSKRILIRDEIDGAPVQLRTGEGNWLQVSYGRTTAWEGRRRILDISTPTLEETSQIYAEFKQGDQRYFFVPCPLCGKEQILVFRENDSQKHGLFAETVAGNLVDAYYVCEYCGDAFFNSSKVDFLIKGRWIPSVTERQTVIRSYQISSLYSPVHIMSWKAVMQKYNESLEDPEGARWFDNLYRGIAHKERGTRPKLEGVVELREVAGYLSGFVPKDVIYLTIGADVQRGSDDGSKGNPSRIELEVLGTGLGYRTWSIGYFIFHGPVDVPNEGAWKALNEWAMSGGLTFRREGGGVMSASLIFFDSGDGVTSGAVYRFVDGWRNTYPSKGFGFLRRKRLEHSKSQVDEVREDSFRKYRAAKLPDSRILYQISTNYYKQLIYNNLNLKPAEEGPDPAGMCYFPSNYPDEYFSQLTAEERNSDGSFRLPSGRRNEALDCRVYAMAAADAFLDAKVLEMRAAAKASGSTPDTIGKINSRLVLELMKKRLHTSGGA